MRILWSSNSPFVASGYGQQTAIACQRLKAKGHDVAIFAFYGLQGAKLDWGDIPIYPNNPQDWGVKHAPVMYDDFKADILITLVDVWVLGDLEVKMNWAPWLPVDHDPPPPLVIHVLKKSSGLVKPIAMSRYGQRSLAKYGIESYYIPHTVNTELFKPMPEWRKVARDRYEWQDKFIIGTVGTNHVERKNWNASMKAVKIFADRHPGEVVYYMHTNPADPKGINLLELRKLLDMEDITKFPSQSELIIGIAPDAMARMYNAIDVFLLPSKGEGFGVPYIEAQACGTPVIMTKCTGQTELMGGGWFIKKLTPFFTYQGSWQFECEVDEVVECLEKAYQAKKDGSIARIQHKARKKAMQYDENKVFEEYWPSVLADIEKRLKEPKNLEGVQGWRLAFIPRVCMPRKALDLGCGLTQSYRQYLEPLGEYTGVDIRNGHKVVQADAHDLPFEDGEFGFVWCSELLEHVDYPEKVLAEAKRVGKHGVMIFNTPQNQSFKMDPDHKMVKIPHTLMATGDGLITW